MRETLSIKVSPAEKAMLKKMAEVRGVKISSILREALHSAAKRASPEEQPSCYEATARYFEEPDWLGASKEGDLSVNKERLAEFGENKPQS
jgi:hypothetical protein